MDENDYGNNVGNNFLDAYQTTQNIQDNNMRRNLYRLKYQQAMKEASPEYQQKLAQQQQQEQTLKRYQGIADVLHKTSQVDPSLVKKMWPVLTDQFPELKKVNPDDISFEGNTLMLKNVKDQNGKPTGVNVIYDSTTKKFQQVHAASTSTKGKLTDKQKADYAGAWDTVNDLRKRGVSDQHIGLMPGGSALLQKAKSAEAAGVRKGNQDNNAYDPLSDPALMK